MLDEEELDKVFEEHMDLIEDENFEEFFKLSKVRWNRDQFVNFFYDADVDLLSFVPDLRDTNIKVSGCNAVKEVTLNDNVQSIPQGEFEDCVNLKNVYIPSSVASIGPRAFAGCESLTSLTIPEGVSVLPAGLCMNCKNLEELKLPSTIREIEGAVLNGCPKVKVYIKDKMFADAEAEGVTITPPKDFMNIIKKKELGGQGRGVHY